jgi:hypothetical protein
MSDWLTAAQAEQHAPLGTPPGNLYFTFTSPAGDTFIGPAANAEMYLRHGFTVTGEQLVEDSDSFRRLVSPGSDAPPADGTATTEATATAGITQQTPPAP